MQRWQALLVIALALAVLPMGGRARNAAATPTADIAPEVAVAVADEGQARVLVELAEDPMRPAEGTNRAALRSRIARAQAPVIAGLDAGGFTLTHRFEAVPGFAGEVNADALARLQADPRVKSVVLDGVMTGALAESAALINADDMRDTHGVTGAGVNVAVLDTGFDSDHPALADSLLYEECWLADGSCPLGGTHTSGPGSAEDNNNHGTHVSGEITSNGVVGAKGIAPDAMIASYKILNAGNSGFFSDIVAALDDIVANHPEIDVVNMSLGDGVNRAGTCDTHMPTMTAAINSLRTAGALTVVASMNNGYTTGIAFPACVSNAIAVGAVWDLTLGTPLTISGCSQVPVTDLVTCWSNSASTIDVLAPGALVVAPIIGGGTAGFAGTSMATPHTAGVIAQLLEQDPALTPAQIETALEDTGNPRTDPKNGIIKPRIDALAAAISLFDADGDLLPAAGDNCPDDTNPGQQNNDRNFIDLPPSKPYDDTTSAHSDLEGDACDGDDDNDGITDADEATGAACGGEVTLPLSADSDGDRALDGAECDLAADPTDPLSKPLLPACGATTADVDADGVHDRVEYCYYNTSPSTANTDGDACSDEKEIASINADNTVNAIDLSQMAQSFGNSAQPQYIVNFDTNKDGVINAIDLSFVAQRFGGC